jgi:hypothetical protein
MGKERKIVQLHAIHECQENTIIPCSQGLQIALNTKSQHKIFL